MADTTSDSSSDSDRLIALNLLSIPRQSICRLGNSLDAWIGREPSAALARSLGVKRSHVVLARAATARLDSVTVERERARELGTHLVTCIDREYPERLRLLGPLAPPVLYCTAAWTEGPSVSVVGSRSMDDYARRVTETMVSEMAEAGIRIVSGFARGVDSTAHRAALDSASGRTVAVLGCGVDVDYPSGTRALARRVTANGTVLSEFPLGTEPQRHHFPIRNRLIAALGEITLVVRAARRSGSLVTAHLALELGQDVFAVPGSILEAASAGTNELIRDGAFPALGSRDIIERLSTTSPWAEGVRSSTPPEPVPDEEPTDPVLLSIRDGIRTVEGIANSLNWSIARVQSRITALELENRIRRVAGAQFETSA